MLSVYRTLSLRYLSRRWFRALLIVASIALGVGILVATHALNETMSRAALAHSNPMAGVVDFMVTNGELRVPGELVAKLRTLSGIKKVSSRIFQNAKILLPDSSGGSVERNVLVFGLDLRAEMQSKEGPSDFLITPGTEFTYIAEGLKLNTPVILGKELHDEISANPGAAKEKWLKIKTPLGKVQTVVRVGAVEAKGMAASIGGFTVILDLAYAAQILGIHDGQVTRIDIALNPGIDPETMRAEITKVVASRGMVRTPLEQDSSMQSVMAGMQTGFTLCGVAALVVGLFLVYNSLSVTVAERRHEIGILLSIGATRGQVLRLFAGEAALMGLAGSLLGIPLGVAMAWIGLEPVRSILNKIFTTVDVNRVEISPILILVSLAIGILTAMFASLVPAFQASRESPAEAVRRIVKATTAKHLAAHALLSVGLMAVGALMILFRTDIPYRLGTYGGLMLVLIGALVASPFLAALFARAIAPLVRGTMGIEWRLASDNLIRSPGRTGLVIGALAAGVSLVVQTAGTIRSNRIALRDWVRDSIAADLIVTTGGLTGGGDQMQPMLAELAAHLEAVPGVERALPVRMLDTEFRSTRIRLLAAEIEAAYHVEKTRHVKAGEVDLYKKLYQTKNGTLMSENFGALHKVKVGEVVTLYSNQGEVHLKVVGALVDYSWNKGTLIVNRSDFIANWKDELVSIFDIYLHDPREADKVKEVINRKHHGLMTLTHSELQRDIDDTIEQLYSIAYAQQIVVMMVAALGVIMALLISVLQRRREMGLLRAIGASRGQVIYSVLAEAALMGLIGTIIGLMVGIPLQWYILEVVILEESGFLFPVLIPWMEGLAIAGAAIVISTLAGYGPALHSVRQRIPDAIAYE